MAEIKTQQFTVEPDPGNPGAELSLRKLDPYMTPVAQIGFGNDSNTYLSFQSYVGGSMSEQMRIHTNGNVGIGTASPAEKLEVAGTVKATAFDGNLNGGQITTGTVAASRIDTAILRTSDLAVPNGIATLDSNSLVVQNPANATTTPTQSKIPIADASGKLAAGWGGNASTLATLDANTRVVQPASTVWDGTAARSASPAPAANTILVSNAAGKISSGWGGSAGTIATLDAYGKVVETANTAKTASTANYLAASSVYEGFIGFVTVTSSPTLLTSLDLGNVTNGDYFFAELSFRASKGAAAGNVSLYFQKSTGSAATIGPIANAHSFMGNTQTVDANSSGVPFSLCLLIRVNTTGTLILEAYGKSAGSNLSNATGAMAVHFIKKQK